MRLDDRQADARRLHVAIAAPDRAQQLAAADFEPHEVVGVIDHAHLVGFGVAHPDVDASEGALRSSGSDRCAASFRALVAAVGIGRVEDGRAGDDDLDTRVDGACDVRQIDAAVDFDRRCVLPARSSIARIAATFCRLFGMNFCPPKPGLTDITRMKSTSPAISSSATSGRRRVRARRRL